jgi:formylglycine-generating enzyme required for sulfatase activity/serine/threonine protein kinase
MVTADAKGAILTDDDRRQLESWVEGFDRDWDDGLLASRASGIPPDSSLRLPALTEMVKIDLERQWRQGKRVTLETYLAQYPELGTPADVSADLIRVEFEVRHRFGASADLEDYARRFPRQAEALRRLIEAPVLPAPEPVVASASNSSRRIPKQFGRYEILKPLGRGGMGAVFLAQDTKLGRKVALKVPSFGPDDGPEALARFDREAHAAATLDHPNICPVYDVGVIDGSHYLTMAYIEGKSLAETIAEEGPHAPRKAAAIVGKLALALQEAHARGIVHRDLKPSNVMMKEAGKRREPVLVDFGLARELGTEDVRLTQSGTALGTVAYMAPEQIRSAATIGPGTDIYGLGVILYELLTGRPPFEGPAFVVAAQILTQEPPSPSSERPGIDARIEAICRKAMSKASSSRYSTMAEFAAAIADYLRAEPAPIPAAPPSPSRAAAVPRPAADRVETPSGDAHVAQFLGRQAGAPNEAAARSGLMTPEPIIPQPQAPEPEAPEPEAGPSRAGTGRRPGMIALAASAAAALILLAAIVIYVVTDKGRIKIVVDDPQAVVKVDGGVVRIEDLGEPITLRAGEHALEVKWGDGEFATRKFVVRRGENEALAVTYEPRGDGVVGRKSVQRDETPPREVTSRATGMVLVHIGPGEFDMGSGDDDKGAESHEKPRHHIRITKSYYLGKYEVTRGQFRRFVDDTGYKTEGERDGTGAEGWNENKTKWVKDPKCTWLHPGFEQTDEHPVVDVSWNDAAAFCAWLSKKEGGSYRLPTEAEWEYACRAGSTTRYSFGDDPGTLGDFAWFVGNADYKTHPVGQKKANGFGLYDMIGNVWEWSSDRHARDYYQRSPADDPQGPSDENLSNRVRRGGGWAYDPRYCRSTVRFYSAPACRDFNLGFRVVRAG